MSREADLTKNTAVLLAGNLCTKIAQFLLLPLYTGLLLPEEYGTVELANTVVTLLLPIINLQIDQGVFRFLIDARADKRETRKLLSTSFAFVFVANILCSMVFVLVAHYIDYPYKWFILLNLVTNSLFSFALQVARGVGNNKAYAVSSFLSTVVTIGFNILFLTGLHLRADGLLYASAIGYALSTAYIFCRLKLLTQISIHSVSRRKLVSLLKYSVPVVFNSLSWWVFLSSDRIIISSAVGVSATGILSIAYKFSSIGIVIYNVFYMSVAESVALHIKDDDFEAFYNKIFVSISQIFISLSTLIVAFMPVVFNLLVNENYDEAYNLIPVAILATVFQVFVGLYSTIYTAQGDTKSIAITSLVAAVVNISVDLLTVRTLGVYAAVVSTLISYLVLFAHRLVGVRRKFAKIRFAKSLLLNLSIGCIAVSCLFYIRNPVIAVLNVALAITTAYVYNKENIAHFLKTVRSYRGMLKANK